MIKRIYQVFITVAFIAIVLQFLLVAQWHRELSGSYYYGLADSWTKADNTVVLSDGKRVSIPENYHVSGWPVNGRHRWSILREGSKNHIDANIYLDRFGARGVPIIGIQESMRKKLCHREDGLDVCQAKSGGFRYISDGTKKRSDRHACAIARGRLGEGGASQVQITTFYLPLRKETLVFSSAPGDGVLQLEAIGHLLEEISYRPSKNYLLSCLGAD